MDAVRRDLSVYRERDRNQNKYNSDENYASVG